jgi:hypothetical protein
MTSKEQFDEWLNDGVYAEIEHHYKDHHRNFGLMAWQARGGIDAKRIAELKAKLAIAIEALEKVNLKELSCRFDCQMVAVEALTKIKGE